MVLVIMVRTLQMTLLFVWLSATGRVVADFLMTGYLPTLLLSYFVSGLGLGILAPRLLELPYAGGERLPAIPTLREVVDPSLDHASGEEPAPPLAPGPYIPFWERWARHTWFWMLIAVPSASALFLLLFWLKSGP